MCAYSSFIWFQIVFLIIFFSYFFTGPEPHKVNTGLAVFLTIVVIGILGSLAFLYYRNSKRQLLPTFENPMYNNNNRDAAHSDSKDNKSLIGNIEITE